MNMPCRKLLKPDNAKIVPIRLETLNSGQVWAKHLTDKMFNYKGSLSSILNLVTNIAPGCPVFLVGNDFGEAEYFFQKEWEMSPIYSEDFSVKIVKKKNTHMSFVPTDGHKTIADKMPFMIAKMLETNNRLYCVNPNSLLVIKAGVEYKKLPVDEK